MRPRLLALRALGLGDFLTAVPAYRALAAAFPGHERVLAAPAAFAPLERLLGCFHRVVDARPLAPLPEPAAAPDVAVNLHGSGPESHRILLALRPRRLIGFAHPDVPESLAGPRWVQGEHEVHRWCRLLRFHGIAADPQQLSIERPPAPPLPSGYTLLHPGAASEARCWPVERWAAVARAESRAGRRVVLTGDTSEQARVDAVADLAGAPAPLRLAGTQDLAGLAALIGGARLVVCGDTGVAHLATALRRPSVLLFGPTAPAAWGPCIDPTLHRVLWKGGTGDPHGAVPDPALLQIGVDEVLAAIADLDRAAGGTASASSARRRS